MERISNISLSLTEDERFLKNKAAKLLKCNENSIKYIRIVKKSIDARHKNDIRFIYTLDVDFENYIDKKPQYKTCDERKKVVVVGLGPCGLFCALNLARRGLNPIVFERGACVEERKQKVDIFSNGGALDCETNIQFGEGGAGAFSDGKLNTQVNNRLIDEVLRDFVEFGAPSEIAYIAKPHIGSDKLPSVVKNIRNEILKLGGEVHFNSKLDDIVIKNGRVYAVKVNGNLFECDEVVLCVGHSSRDTFEMLEKNGVMMEQKEFAVGLRIEQLQSMINEKQFGNECKNPKLGSADYKFVSHANSERSAFTFCMCPGGFVVAATSEENAVVTNGMSNFLRNGKNANSAIVAQVKKSDFANTNPLAGVFLQREMEKKAFELGGKNYACPIQLAEDFVKDRNSTKLKGVIPTYARGYEYAKLQDIFPKPIAECLKVSLIDIDNKYKGFASQGAVLSGVESRTSSPVRVLRGDSLQSVNIVGLYPCGEGAGYAGGIMSAAIDGIRVALKICGEND